MIRVKCECGQTLQVASPARGKVVRCRRCNAKVHVPLERAAGGREQIDSKQRKSTSSAGGSSRILLWSVAALCGICLVVGVGVWVVKSAASVIDVKPQTVNEAIAAFERTTEDLSILQDPELFKDVRTKTLPAETTPVVYQFSDFSVAVPALELLLRNEQEAVPALVARLREGPMPIVMPKVLYSSGSQGHTRAETVELFQLPFDIRFPDNSVSHIDLHSGADAFGDWITTTLVLIGEPAAPAVAGLRWDKDLRVQMAAYWVLQELGKTPAADLVPAEACAGLLTALRDGNAVQRIYAQETLIRAGQDAIPAFQAARWDTSVEVQLFCVQQLARLNVPDAALEPVPPAAIPGLLQASRHSNEAVRDYAVGCLDRLDPESAAALATFAAAEGDRFLRLLALTALRRFETGGADAAPILVAFLLSDADDYELLVGSVEVLDVMRAAPEVTMPALVQRWRYPNADVVRAAVGTVFQRYLSETTRADEQISLFGCQSMQELVDLLLPTSDTDLLFPLLSDEATAALIQRLGAEEMHVRRQALAALGSLGDEAHAAVPEVISLLNTETDQSVIRQAIYTLTRIGRNSPDVHEFFIASAAVDSIEAWRYQQALEQIGPAPLDVLITLLSVEDSGVTSFVVQQLQSRSDLESLPNDCLPALLKVLESPANDVAHYASKLILSHFSTDAATELCVLLEHENVVVRRRAASLLRDLSASGIEIPTDPLIRVQTDSDPSIRIVALRILAASNQSSPATVRKLRGILDEELGKPGYGGFESARDREEYLRMLRQTLDGLEKEDSPM